ncbi:MAG: DUF3489 domain-containing protein [Geminicoccaceae bacterium]
MTNHSHRSANTKTSTKAKAETATTSKRRSSTRSVGKEPAAVSVATAVATHETDPAALLAPGPARPGGKLGLIVDRLGDKAGMTMEELTAVTGWQAHTVRAALSRLRTRGFATHLERTGDRNAYQLSRQEG